MSDDNLKKALAAVYEKYGFDEVDAEHQNELGKRKDRNAPEKGGGAPRIDERRDMMIFTYIILMLLGQGTEKTKPNLRWCCEWLGRHDVFKICKNPGGSKLTYKSLNKATIRGIYYRAITKLKEANYEHELMEFSAKISNAYYELIPLRVNAKWGTVSSLPDVQIMYQPDQTTTRLIDAGVKELFEKVV